MEDITDNKEGKYLYRFMRFNVYALQLLIDKQFWLAPPDILNDPFEGDFLIKDIDTFQNENFIKTLLHKSSTGYFDDIFFPTNYGTLITNKYMFQKSLSAYLNGKLRSCLGSMSFSIRCNSSRMWSHYADSHKGFVIVFDKNKIQNNLDDSHHRFLQLSKVTYDGLPTIVIGSFDDDIQILNTDSILTHKTSEWTYEDEVRLVTRHAENELGRTYRFDPGCVSGIIFGCKMNPNNKTTLRNVVKENLGLKRESFNFVDAEKSPENGELLFFESVANVLF